MKKITILGLAVLAGLSLGSLAEAQGRAGDRPVFGAVDANGDGAVTPAELAAHRETRRAAHFAARDTDGDGGLSREELATARASRHEDRATAHFARMDADGDGILSQQELEARRDGLRSSKSRHGGERHGGRDQSAMFQRADADGSGTLDATEWGTLGQRHARN